MAAQDYTSVVQQLYISYFGRPADYYGLQNFTTALAALDTKGELKTFAAVSAAMQADKAGTTALSKLVNSFNNSAESNALYGTDNSQIGISKFVAAIYQNVLGREADTAGFNFWVNAITSGALTKANAAAAITQGALDNTSAQGKLDALTVQHKLAVANSFTTALDTPTEINAYSGDAAAAAARALLAGVNNGTDVAAYQADVATSIEGIVAVAVPGKTFDLTTNIDNLVGTQGNDIFNTIIDGTNSAATVFGPLDVVDGGAGRDTLNVADTSNSAVSLGGVTLKSIETLAVSATGAFTNFNIANTGVTNATLTSSATGAASVTVADTTNVTLSVAGTAGATINGGKAVTVTSAGANAVTGGALTNVTVKGGSAAIDNTGAAAATGAGTTLTAVTLDDVSGTNTVKGKGVTTVNLQNIDAAATVTVTNSTTGGHALKLNVNDVMTTGTAADIVVTDATAKTVAVAAAGDAAITLTAAAATAATVTGAGDIELALAGSVALKSVDASAATGAVTLSGAAATVATITTGSGDDTVTVNTATVKDDSTTTNDETLNATVDTGAGDDSIDVHTSGTGLVTVNAGAGDDTVNVTARGTGALNINLGAGNDTFMATGVQIGANDKIDAGDGTDMLALALVGSANIGAFSNFDAFDAAGLNKTLDVEILSAKNSVTEIVTTGNVGTASLINLGAGVGYRIEGTATDALSITQKTAGDLTVTLDIDESGDDAATVAADTTGAVTATNATGIKAVFDSSFVAKAQSATDNVADLTVTAVAAKTMSVVSGGDFASNVLHVAAGAPLTTISVTGASHLEIAGVTGATALATIDASAATGGLTASLALVKDGGSIKLGSGADLITVTNASTTAGVESISGFEKTSATAVSSSADATSKAALIADADMLSFTGAVADALSVAGGAVTAKGILTFTGSGPSTLAAAAGIADLAANADGEALVFEYLGNSYVFVQGGAAADTLVQLTGVTGITNLAEDGSSNHFFIV
jgi:hypothetical protein